MLSIRVSKFDMGEKNIYYVAITGMYRPGVCGAVMWISKEGDVRKQELLDAALQLFQEKGYENTTINDIIGSVGVTKGAFYYYFDSKEEILCNVAQQQADSLLEVAQNVLSDASVNALEKLNAIAARALEARAAGMKQKIAAYKALRTEGGIMLGMSILEKTVEKGVPIICAIIEQGVQDGIFETQFPKEAAELYIYLSSYFSGITANLMTAGGNADEAREAILKKLRFYEDVIVRLLGIKNGRVEISAYALKYL